MKYINKYQIRRFVWTMLLTGSVAIADAPQYLGLTLNIDTQDSVKKTLKHRGATFDTGFGYKGYSDLASIKVNYDPIFGQQGQLNHAWLSFTPQGTLYRIYVQWNDAGETFQAIHDVLESKYARKGKTLQGFVYRYRYHNGDVKVILERNAFGFGKNQKTSLEYLHTPSLSAVERMKAKIEQDIKTKNIKDKGKNL